jgi:hypothetical protein
VKTIRLTITESQAEALGRWIAYLDVAPTDFEESSPKEAAAVRRVGEKLAVERVAIRRTR